MFVTCVKHVCEHILWKRKRIIKIKTGWVTADMGCNMHVYVGILSLSNITCVLIKFGIN